MVTNDNRLTSLEDKTLGDNDIIKPPDQLQKFPKEWDVPRPPAGWRTTRAGLWTAMMAPADLQAWGWKVHVSSTLSAAPHVLRIVAEVAYKASISFKYLPNVQAFMKLHSKGANRLQSGKFIALYPEEEEVAADLMRSLSKGIPPTIEGPDILTDRLFAGSQNVFYRWGAYLGTGRVNDLGEPEELIPDGYGCWVPDLRLPTFSLPSGITDPFRSGAERPAYSSSVHTVGLGSYTVTSAIRFSNAGGIYFAVHEYTQQEVVIKEARPHTGFIGGKSASERLAEEAAWLLLANEINPKLAPTLVEQFSVRGHDFLALERVPGRPLHDWIAQECPLYSSDHRSSRVIEMYLQRVTPILDSIRANLDVLHSHGIAFGDLSPSNILIDSSDVPRFVDFEACIDIHSQAPSVGTPDFCLLRPRKPMIAKDRDDYAFHSIALAFVLRLTSLAEISDQVLLQLENELATRIQALPAWWREARRYVTRTTTTNSAIKRMGYTGDVRDDGIDSTRSSLLAAALLECYSPGEQAWLFPTSRKAMHGASASFSCGDSGVLATLAAGHHELPPGSLQRYRRMVEHTLTKGLLPLGHSYGLVGVADTCAALGLHDLAEQALDVVVKKWVDLRRPDLATGLAGVALTLARHGRTSEAIRVLTAAYDLCAAYRWEKNGLLYGRTGVAAAVCEMFELLPHNSSWGVKISELLEQELAQTKPLGLDSLSLRSEPDGGRVLPYLADGTAGLILTLSMASQLPAVALPATQEDIVRLSYDLETPFTLEGTLMNGAAGLAVTQELLRRRMPHLNEVVSRPDWSRLSKHLVPLASGIGTLNPRTQRFDLSHEAGSAGILATLNWAKGNATLNLSSLIISPLPHSDESDASSIDALGSMHES